MCILQCGAYNKSIDTHTQNYEQKTEKHRKKTLLLVSMHVTGKK